MQQLKYFLLALAFVVFGFSPKVQGATESRNAPFAVKTARVGDIELAYYTRGSGKPLIMIMGLKGTMAMWDPALLEALEKHYQLILFDNRGAGRSSDSVENKTTIAQMADDTAGLIKALGFNKANVLGWSMGGRIAQQLAIRHPQVVEKIILCSTNPGGTHLAKKSEEVMKQLDAPRSPDFNILFPPTAKGQQESKEYLARVNRAFLNGTIPEDYMVSQETTQRQNGACGKPWTMSDENFEALATIKIPTLVVGGIDDIIDVPDNIRIIVDQIPYAWSAYFPGGHAFLFENAKPFSELIFAFLQ
jgi:pimeloyl-ACP methyl ester carboxylesterase